MSQAEQPTAADAAKGTKAKLQTMMHQFNDFEGVMKEGTRVRTPCRSTSSLTCCSNEEKKTSIELSS